MAAPEQMEWDPILSEEKPRESVPMVQTDALRRYSM